VDIWNRVLIKVVVGGVRTLDGWYGILYGELTVAALLLLLLLCNVQLSMGGLLGGFWIFTGFSCHRRFCVLARSSREREEKRRKRKERSSKHLF
jgi:hypothetical protein